MQASCAIRRPGERLPSRRRLCHGVLWAGEALGRRRWGLLPITSDRDKRAFVAQEGCSLAAHSVLVLLSTPPGWIRWIEEADARLHFSFTLDEPLDTDYAQRLGTTLY